MITSFDNTILDEKLISAIPVDPVNTNTFHVAFGVDEQYIKCMGITILSLVKNNPNITFIFHIFYGSITQNDLDKLNKLVTDNKTTVKLYRINQEVFNNLPTNGHITSATYNRLLVVNRLKNIVDKVLYLDADIVCLGDISEMLTINIDDYIVAAVKEAEHAISNHIKNLNLTVEGYFNAGVLYINVNKWHANNISEKVIKVMIENYDRFTLVDQDGLNVVLDKNILYIDQKWNYLFDINKDTIPSNIKLLHYAGKTKPWSEWCVHPVKDYFVKYYQESPWRDIEFDKPTHYKHMKIYAKTSRKYGSLWKSIYWYFKYVQAKLKQN
ncbi:glycosyltransferase [Anaerospora sp.]|uniref:glycosyltransferase family 8 protein n=1 Tax=Anaerospora sp. TaxID=1960278 RepID=UPI00289F1F2A|nr:glycosyltransferase [Anaerospora sp.]